MQVPGRVHLGPQHRGEPLRRQRLQHPVVQHPSRVHHPDQRELRWHSGQQLGQGGPVSGVTGHDRHLGSQRTQLVDQLSSTGDGQPTPAGQQQMASALFRQVPCHQTTQRAGSAGHQHGPVRVSDRPGFAFRGRPRPPDPRYQNSAIAQRQLRLRTVDKADGKLGGVAVQQDESSGVFELSSADQTPHHGSGQIRHGFGGIHRDRSARHQDKPRLGQAVFGQPPLEQVERVGGHALGAHRWIIDGGLANEEREGHLRNRIHRGQRRDVRKGLCPGHGEAITEHRTTGRAGRTGPGRCPVQPEQGLVPAVPATAELLRGHRTNHQRLHESHWRAGLVRNSQRDRGWAGRGHPNPEAGCAGRSQQHIGPGERQMWLFPTSRHELTEADHL